MDKQLNMTSWKDVDKEYKTSRNIPKIKVKYEFYKINIGKMPNCSKEKKSPWKKKSLQLFPDSR